MTPEQTEQVIAHAISSRTLAAAIGVSTDYIRVQRLAVEDAGSLFSAAGVLTKVANSLQPESKYRELLSVAAAVVQELACAEMDLAVEKWKETQ